MLNEQCSVYMVVNRHTGHMYIGVSNDPQTRFRGHLKAIKQKNPGFYFARAVKKHGADAFALFTLKVCNSRQEALSEEMRCIAAYYPEYNITAGGEGVIGFKHSAESKAKISASLKGNRNSKGKFLGRKLSEETKRKISQSMLNRNN